MRDCGRIVIIGSGPTGLGAAYRLQELGYTDYEVLEKEEGPGGLAGSFLDRKGFTWDFGGHVQFSHYRYYDEVLDRAIENDWIHHERESWIWMQKRFVPYPFQNNLHRLDPADCREALRGLVEAHNRGCVGQGRHLHEWLENTFGDGIARLFLIPYNLKVWGYPLQQLETSWIGERVPVPDVDRICANVELGQDDISWGPNQKFRFPLQGGTGSIWHGVTHLLQTSHLHFQSEVQWLDLEDRVLHLANGHRLAFDRLINSMPLDVLCKRSSGLSRSAIDAASRLLYSSSHILGIGLKGARPDALSRKCWMYFPEGHSPYYRVTVFSNYSPYNVPGPDYWSLMAEVCETPLRPVDQSGLSDWALSALREDSLIDDQSQVVSIWCRRLDYGYPTPFLGREEVLASILGELETRGVYSRGRFGAWRYEVSNQDHSFMQGVELVNRLLRVGEEYTVKYPDYVNGGVFLNKDPWPP